MKTALSLLVLLACVGFAVFKLMPGRKPVPEIPNSSTVASQAATPAPYPLVRGQGTRPPTPEEMADEQSYRDAQVQLAGAWLNSANVEEQMAGAEQLSAFPTPEAELLLATALTTAFDPTVRVAAAVSLHSFTQPSARATDALLAALADSSPEVQSAAVNTLQSLATRSDKRSTRFKAVLAGLKKQVGNRYLNPETRQSVTEFLADWDSANQSTKPRTPTQAKPHRP